jgi:DNA-binding phage protein
MRGRGSEATSYGTRLDRFRVRERIDLEQWAEKAGMRRTQLGKYRSGRGEPRADALARLVRAAAVLLYRPVKASELYDLGEDEAIAAEIHRFPQTGQEKIRRVYDSKIDAYLRRIDAAPASVARAAGMSRQSLLNLRSEAALPMCSTIRALVIALRRRGYAVTASDLFDVGESRDTQAHAIHEAKS